MQEKNGQVIFASFFLPTTYFYLLRTSVTGLVVWLMTTHVDSMLTWLTTTQVVGLSSVIASVRKLGPVLCDYLQKEQQLLLIMRQALVVLLDWLPEEGFLDADPETLGEREDFQKAEAAMAGPAVVNDHAERGVALIQEYIQPVPDA